ncbi:YbhB/YbcL family Raf kinase inhibitor-like protein [Naasia aerilata]|uniref:YbhB/YbcL family Raf kinase inhibitor-like protein n=1 Tax=Naasia aerilata TaxID=1162966 RepID=A0ABN6XMX4_9MICO|nr:YbhB/YbcL family Raf kinase inhibitor-like protein [Naasia aerilata]BDZ46347.1 hypothetical protein GCM10025866_22560 [Naasia aerilata]
MSEHDPYAIFNSVPSFEVTSTDVSHGELVPAPHWGDSGGGDDVSPQLSWSGAPEGTKSFAVTVYDPDAPTASGFWHWAVYNIPAGVTELAQNAGAAGGDLPAGARTLKNEMRLAQYSGPTPPDGTGRHRYFFVVWALDTTLDLDPEATPAILGFNAGFHALGRGTLVATAEYGDIPA